MDYSTPITSEAAARQFIVDLFHADKLFHFDDAPETIIDGNGNRIFNDTEVPLISQRVTELFAYLSDPFAIAVSINQYPEFFDMDIAELTSRLSAFWRSIPDSDDARNVDYNESDALELAIQTKKGI